MQPNVYDTLRKAASNRITAKTNGGFTRLEAKNYDPRLNRLGYTFCMEQPEQTKPMLTVHIDLLTDGAEHISSTMTVTNSQKNKCSKH